ncbi:MAG: M23 family metallopeptidase [Alphaproteobacteria bacterium]|nr:M23 family metallopeptidase [Alphaproteobacteria bacterium]
MTERLLTDTLRAKILTETSKRYVLLKSPLGLVRADSLCTVSVFRMLAVSALALSVGLSGHYWKRQAAVLTASAVPAVQNAVRAVETSVPGQAVAKVNKAVAQVIVPPESVTREAEVAEGQNFSEMLGDAGVADADAMAAMNAVAKVFNMQKLRAGQDVTLTFSRTPTDETFTSAVFQPEDTKEITVTRQADGAYVANIKMIPIIRERLASEGKIRSSVFEAGDRAGVPRAVMAAMIRVYAHSIDFQRDIHPGDTFEILYDQPKTVHGKPVGEGAIIYAAMRIGGEVKPIYRVTFIDKTVDYFDAAGRSVRRALLRTPVAAAHVTSGFGMRMHPLLGYSKMHKGVDFGASTGTPIFAAGSGIVEKIGFKGGFGRYILIKHSNGMETAYGHMSRFNTRLYRGARVNQGEVIAYVGSSGRSTGPHLHFEVHQNGRQVNPLSIKMPVGRVLEGAQLAQFKSGQAHIYEEYASLIKKKDSSQPQPLKVSATTPSTVTK